MSRSEHSSFRLYQSGLVVTALTAAATIVLAGARELGVRGPTITAVLAAGVILTVALGAATWRAGKAVPKVMRVGAMGLAFLAAGGSAMALAAAVELVGYLRLPVDLLSFSESPFVDDIIKIKLGMPIYTPPADNNSYPYTPGAQILTWAISSALGASSSISFFRIVQFSYVVLSVMIATASFDMLARNLLSQSEYRHRPMWLTVGPLFLFLIAVDPRFNPYVHSLHNDGLALLVSAVAFWLLVRDAVAPRRWHLRLMVLLPAIGFLVKQNLLLWLPLFVVYLAGARRLGWWQLARYVALSGSAALMAVAVGYLLWDDPFIFWVFRALGQKQVFPLRSVTNLVGAGHYAAMGFFGGWVLVTRDVSRRVAALWVCWLLLFLAAAWTSGIGFVVNHFGPAVVIAGVWFFVGLATVWPNGRKERSSPSGEGWRVVASEALLAAGSLLFLGSLGLLRQPRNPIPRDFSRYMFDIEREFAGFSADKVLLDTGSWIYLREGVLMKDRSPPVALHVGTNQPEINRSMLAATIARIEGQVYEKILAREVDGPGTWYDFQNRGSGVRSAILENYRIVRRIPEVKDVSRWWPQHLISEVVVLVPAQARSSETLLEETRQSGDEEREES